MTDEELAKIEWRRANVRPIPGEDIDRLIAEVRRLNQQLMAAQAHPDYERGYLDGAEGACHKIVGRLRDIVSGKKMTGVPGHEGLREIYARVADLSERCRWAAEVMRIQEQREAGTFHLSATAFRPMWDDAVAKLEGAVGDPL